MRLVLAVVLASGCAEAVSPGPAPLPEPTVVADDPGNGAIAIAADDDGVYWVDRSLEVIALTGDERRVIRPSWGEGTLLGLAVTEGVVVLAGDAPAEAFVEAIPTDGEPRWRLATDRPRSFTAGLDARDGFAAWPSTLGLVEHVDLERSFLTDWGGGGTRWARIDGDATYWSTDHEIAWWDGRAGGQLVGDCAGLCRFAVDGGHLFYPALGVRLVDVDLETGEKTELATELGVIEKLVVDDRDVYAMTNSDGVTRTIWRVPRDGGDATQLVDLPTLVELAVGAAGVYVLDQGRVLLLSR